MVKDNTRIGIICFLLGLAFLLMCIGCTKVVYRDVKIPVPVPCDNQPTNLSSLPVAKWSDARLGKAIWTKEEIQELLDDTVESLILADTDRKNFKERLDACR